MLYHARTKRELVELIAKTAPDNAVKFKIGKRLEPDGWLVEFGTGSEANGFYSVEMIQKAFGIFSEKAKLITQVSGTTTKAWVAARLGRVGFVILD